MCAMLDPRELDRLTRQALERCDVLATLSEEPGRLTRTFLSAPARQVQSHVTQWMEQAGLRVRCDAAGNIIGRREPPGGGPEAKTFVLGSHLDTVPDAGKYDGVLGVMLAIATAGALCSTPLPFALEVIGFSDEEGVRFGAPFIGSRTVAGTLDAALLSRRDAGGTCLADAIRAYGQDPGALEAAAYPPHRLLGYLEAHIEQGPVLEALGLALGVVSAITSTARLELTFSGRAGHAGTSPMAGRKDALAGAAAFVQAVERHALDTPNLVATVGRLEVQPGASNVIPGEVRLSLDVRHPQTAQRDSSTAALLREAVAIAAARGLSVAHELVSQQPGVPCDPWLTAELSAVLRQLHERPAPALVSGAGHDAMIMASLTPIAMLFIRSVGGVSHHPSEAVLPEDVRAALAVMHAFICRLAAGGAARSMERGA